MTAKSTAWVVLKFLFFGGSIAFLAMYAASLSSSGASLLLTAPILGAAALASVAFALTAPFMALVWVELLRPLGWPASFPSSASSLFRTQIAKYLPGNIGHHVGRSAVAKAELGIPISVSVTTILQESALATFATCCAGVTLLLLSFPETIVFVGGQRLPVVAVAVAMAAAFAIAFPTLHVIRAALAARAPAKWRARINGALPSLRVSLRVVGLYTAMHFFNILAISIIANEAFDPALRETLALCGAYLLAWSIGFVLPGAPGGLGVREAAFVMMMDGRFPPDLLLSLSIVLRAATALADCLIFLAGSVLKSVAHHETRT
jgi:hypothetical protein